MPFFPVVFLLLGSWNEPVQLGCGTLGHIHELQLNACDQRLQEEGAGTACVGTGRVGHRHRRDTWGLRGWITAATIHQCQHETWGPVGSHHYVVLQSNKTAGKKSSSQGVGFMDP